MKLYTQGKKVFGRVVLATAALGTMLAFGAAPRAFARHYDDDRCQRRVAKADHKLHEAIEHHGWYSRQADHARHGLHEARESCWGERHGLGGGDGPRSHTGRHW